MFNQTSQFANMYSSLAKRDRCWSVGRIKWPNWLGAKRLGRKCQWPNDCHGRGTQCYLTVAKWSLVGMTTSSQGQVISQLKKVINRCIACFSFTNCLNHTYLESSKTTLERRVGKQIIPFPGFVAEMTCTNVLCVRFLSKIAWCIYNKESVCRGLTCTYHYRSFSRDVITF